MTPSQALSIAHASPADGDRLRDWVTQLMGRSPREADSLGVPLAPDIVQVIENVGRMAEEGDRDAEEAIHGSLARLYELTLNIPPAERKGARGSAVLELIKTALEREALAALGQLSVPAYPEDPQAFVAALETLARSHAAGNHPFYSMYLASRATREDLRHYFIQELSVDGRFDDMVALLQIGTGGAAKMELAHNYWDEMGQGSPDAVHTDLFAKVIQALEITPEEIVRASTHESRVCGNFSVMLASRRDLFLQATGYFGVMEFLVPQRMRDVLVSWERNGLDPHAVEYHRVHIHTDDRHASGWFKNIIEPILRARPSSGAEIMAGAQLRLETSQRYLDSMHSNLERRKSS